MKLLLLSLGLLLVSCGGGGEKEKGAEVTYRIDLDKTGINFVAGEEPATHVINIHYQGEGLEVIYADQVAPVVGLGIQLDKLTSSSAQLFLSETSQGFALTEPVSIELQVITGTAGTDKYAKKTIRVNISPRKPTVLPVASLTLDKDDIQLFAPLTESRSAKIKISYEGKGISVDYLEGETPLVGLGWVLREIDSNSQELTITEVSPGIPDGDNPISVNLRVSTGAAGSDYYAAKIVRVTVTPQPPLTLTALQGQEAIRGELGYEQSPAVLLLNANRQAWQVTTNVPGVSISPSSGVGSKQLTISSANVIDTDLIKIIINTGSRTITHEVPVDIAITEFVGLPAEVAFSKQKQGVHAPVQIPIALLNNGVAGWTADFPEWLLSSNLPYSFVDRLPGTTGVVLNGIVPGVLSDKASGVTGDVELELFVNHNFPFVDGVYEGFIDIDVPVPAKTLNKKIKIKLPFEKHRIQSSQNAFSFSDYGTHDEHQGSFDLNLVSPIPLKFKSPLDSIVAVSSEPWVEVNAGERSINFNLAVADLPEGFHLAEIRVESTYSNLFVGDVIKIGYYKSNLPMPVGKVTNLAVSEDIQIVSDKLGPWIYYVDPVANTPSLDVIKYNLFTHQIDKVFSIPDADFLSTLAVSDDGTTLYARDDRKVLHKVDLIGEGTITSVQTESEAGNVHQQLTYARINGRAMLVTHDNGKGVDGIALDVENGKKIHGGENYTKITSRPQGDLAFIGSQWVVYDFNYIGQILNVSPPVDFHNSHLPDADSDLNPVVIANNGKAFAFVDYSSMTGTAHIYNETTQYWVEEGLHTGFSVEVKNLNAYPQTRISSLNEIVYIADYDSGKNLTDQVVVSNRSGNKIVYPLSESSDQFLQSWFSLSADEKFLSYLVNDGVDTALYVQPVR